MCRRSRTRQRLSVVPWWLNIFVFITLSWMSTTETFLSVLLSRSIGIITRLDSSEVFQVLRVLFGWLGMLALLKFTRIIFTDIDIDRTKDHVRRIVVRMSSHKSSNGSCREKVFEYTDNVDEVIGFTLRFLYDFSGIFSAALFCVVLACLYLNALVVLVLFFIVVCTRVLPSRCKKSSHFSDFSNASFGLPKNSKDLLNQRAKKEKSTQSRVKAIIQILKKIIIHGVVKTVAEYSDAVCKFLPTLVAAFFVAQGVLSSNLLLVATALCSSLSDALCKVSKIFYTFPEMKRRIKKLRSITGDNDPSSGSDWRYLWQLLTRTGRFAEPKKD